MGRGQERKLEEIKEEIRHEHSIEIIHRHSFMQRMESFLKSQEGQPCLQNSLAGKNLSKDLGHGATSID